MGIESIVGYVDTTPFITFADPGAAKLDCTIAQDAGRTAVLAQYTLMGMNPTTGKYVPCAASVAPTFAKMTCGAVGITAANLEKITDGAFKITVDGTEISLTGLNFTDIVTHYDAAVRINAALAGKAQCVFNGADYVFLAPSAGTDHSVTVLSAGASGTDISDSGHLNGRTSVGVVTAATGSTGTEIPVAIYIGPEIAAATLVAGDVEMVPMIVGDIHFDESQLVFENSITMNTVVTSQHMTIRNLLHQLGLFGESVIDISAYENV
jgi:hypothetical protein